MRLASQTIGALPLGSRCSPASPSLAARHLPVAPTP